MKRLLATALALPLLLSAGVAWAEQTVGTVEKVDPSTKTVWVNGNPYHIEDQAAPLKFEDIKVGEKVRLEHDSTGRGATTNVYEADHAE